MRTRLLNLWDVVLESYWFVPMGMASGMLVLAFGLPMLDKQFEAEVLQKLFWLEITPRSAQSILSSIASANVSIVGVVFSITILTLSIASSQLGPRLLRTFMADRSTHFALGLYLSTAVYCLILLTIVKDIEDSGFVPHISVMFALLAAIFGLGFLIFFIHRIAHLIQTPNIVESVARDLDHAITRLFPEELGEHAGEIEGDFDPAQFDAWEPLHASNEGYLQGIDFDGLMDLATREDIVFRLYHRPGQFISRGMAIAEFAPVGNAGENLDARFNDVFVCGNRRTPRQDLECAISEITEVAVRALSPGVNDPFTALNCVDRLGASLARLTTRKMPGRHRCDKEGNLRVIADAETFSSALNAAFDQIRQYGCKSVAILARILETLCVVAAAAQRPEDTGAIRRQAEMLMRATERHVDEANDRADIEERFARLETVLSRQEA